MDRVLTLELVRATEAAAMRAGRMMGIGDAEAAHHLAATGMHQELAAAPVSGRVVIGEGHMADGQVLFDGEEIGRGRVPVDIAVAALDGQKLVAQGQPGAVSVLAYWLWPDGEISCAFPICTWKKSVSVRGLKGAST